MTRTFRTFMTRIFMPSNKNYQQQKQNITIKYKIETKHNT